MPNATKQRRGANPTRSKRGSNSRIDAEFPPGSLEAKISRNRTIGAGSEWATFPADYFANLGYDLYGALRERTGRTGADHE